MMSQVWKALPSCGTELISMYSAWEGSDDWIRSHFFNYLLTLLKTTRAMDVEGSEASADFNRDFVQAYRESHNFRIWQSGAYCRDLDPESRF
jgi:hypothetical protein